MKYQLLPPLSADDYAALKSSIIACGVLVPVEYDEHGNILDGHHRVAICESLGLVNFPRVVRENLSEDDKRSHVRSLNLARRHLTTFQKREIIEAQLLETPHLSNRTLAKILGVDNKTVLNRRVSLESKGRLRRPVRVQARNGVYHPADRPRSLPSPLMSDGIRLDGLHVYDVIRRIRECEHDLALLRPIVDRGLPSDDRLTVRDVMPSSFFEDSGQ
ncbi:ParB N-terminal domain-containing protein [Neoaquamicrobium sediminum]|uniref:Chromosome segregation protein ParB n=2 Tax=root TaxID=1 RepID=A0AB38ZLH7_9VIRU